MAKNGYEDWDKKELIEEIKSLKKRKKFGLVWESKPEYVVEQCKEKFPVLEEVKSLEISTDDSKPTNLLIEGDNYHALSVLNYTHKGKIDVIYIDPPYNTGAKDWKYNNDFVDKNDGYRHSKWLSMMANRLILAKKLLKRDGVLICAIDENEFNRLGLLLEEIYVEHEIHFLPVVHNPRGVRGKNFSYIHEYACFVFRRGLQVIENKEREVYLHEELRDHGGESLRKNARNCFYPVLVENDKIIGFGDVPSSDFHPTGKNVKSKNKIEVWPIDTNGIERKWVFARHTIEAIQDKLFIKQKANKEIDIFRIKDTQRPKTIWADKKYDASTFGSKVVNNLIKVNFPYPKSIYTVIDCLDCVVRNKKNAIVLDFFAGSGTTGHAVSIINKNDNGNRRFILCTNNENGIAREVCQPRIKAVIKGQADYPDITGILSNLKYFKTTFVPSQPTDQNKKKLTQKVADMLCVRENTFEQVESVDAYKIYRNKHHYTGIIYNEDEIENFKKVADKLKGPFSVYVFSLGDEDFKEEFADMKNKVKPQPIPDAIMRAYRRIFK